MYKAMYMMLLAVVSSSAMAEWISVGENGDDTHYIDPATIRKAGNRVKMWHMNDYRTVQDTGGVRYMSTLSQREYDCKEEQARFVSSSYYSGSMGEGKAVYVGVKPGDWLPVPPKTIGWMGWTYACVIFNRP